MTVHAAGSSFKTLASSRRFSRQTVRIPAHVATVKWRPHSCSLACAGITGFLLLARPAGVRGAAGGSIVRSAAAAPAGPHMELRLAAQQLQPGTNYQLAVHYAHARAGVPNPLLSTPVIKTVRTPDPINPVVVSVAALDPAAVPACRERGAAYDAAGCNDVTILVDPPKSTAVREGARAYGRWLGCWGALQPMARGRCRRGMCRRTLVVGQQTPAYLAGAPRFPRLQPSPATRWCASAATACPAAAVSGACWVSWTPAPTRPLLAARGRRRPAARWVLVPRQLIPVTCQHAQGHASEWAQSEQEPCSAQLPAQGTSLSSAGHCSGAPALACPQAHPPTHPPVPAALRRNALLQLKFKMSLLAFAVGTYQCTAFGKTAQGDTDISPEQPFTVPTRWVHQQGRQFA